MQVQGFEKAVHRIRKKVRVLRGIGNIRITVLREIQGVDGKIFAQPRHGLFEEIELGSQRMQQN